MARAENYKKVNMTSADLSQEKLEELKRIIPEAVGESGVDCEKLRQVLGENVDDSIEKFRFTWAGKSDAIRNVLVPSKATLKPDREESVKFDESENIFIEGDNLEALKLLQKAYFEKVKMIYIDPPYNTGGDFVYKDNFRSPINNYLEQTGQVDSEGNRLKTNPETSGRYHSDWLNMMYPRLKLAWNLLRDDGVIFISIDDNEVHHLRMMMDEIFGEENFITKFIIKSNPRGSQASKHIADVHEYVFLYAKNEENLFIKGLPMADSTAAEYKYNDENNKKYRLLGLRQRGGAWRREQRPKMFYPIYVNPDNGKVSLEKNATYRIEVLPRRPSGEDSRWTWGKDKLRKDINLLVGEKVSKGKDDEKWDIFRIDYKETEDGDERTSKPTSIWDEKEVNYQNGRNEIKALFGNSEIFDFPKPSYLVKKMLSFFEVNNEIILDFFGGSGTTAQAVLEKNIEDDRNRKFIIIQLPENVEEKSESYKAGYKNIADIAKNRINKVITGYGDNPIPINDGFKVFKMCKSNYRENNFEYDPDKSEEENKKALQEYLENAKQGTLFEKAPEIDIVYENIVKEGLSLNSQVSEGKIGKCKIYKASDENREINICLEPKIDADTVKKMIKELKDKTFICLDNALNDSTKANLGLQVELKTI